MQGDLPDTGIFGIGTNAFPPRKELRTEKRKKERDRKKKAKILRKEMEEETTLGKIDRKLQIDKLIIENREKKPRKHSIVSGG